MTNRNPNTQSNQTYLSAGMLEDRLHQARENRSGYLKQWFTETRIFKSRRSKLFSTFGHPKAV